jgi:hypothetical protein
MLRDAKRTPRIAAIFGLISQPISMLNVNNFNQSRRQMHSKKIRKGKGYLTNHKTQIVFEPILREIFWTIPFFFSMAFDALLPHCYPSSLFSLCSISTTRSAGNSHCCLVLHCHVLWSFSFALELILLCPCLGLDLPLFWSLIRGGLALPLVLH